ncbi:energy transducer TonB [Magnetospirillum sp. 15-1]|uniref:energy transducer TonB n=1 Tax=Magnetospirillum sp. 15-1 TaxID=1979370 RepID=UPI000BBC0C1A|nr:energy transducer TonB [Magnetospirillum sp. 15-1]
MLAPDTFSMVLAGWCRDDEPGPPGRAGRTSVAWTLPVSVALHAGILLALVWTADHLQSPPPPPKPLPVEIITLAPPRPEPKVSPPAEAVKDPGPPPPQPAPQARPVPSPRPSPARHMPEARPVAASAVSSPLAAPVEVGASAAEASVPSTRPVSTPPATASADEVGLYLAEVRRKLQAHLDYPFAARRMKLGGIVHIRLRVATDGVVEERSMTVTASSGAEILDEAGLATIRRASPFPPPPGGRALVINVPVVFELRRG